MNEYGMRLHFDKHSMDIHSPSCDFDPLMCWKASSVTLSFLVCLTAYCLYFRPFKPCQLYHVCTNRTFDPLLIGLPFNSLSSLHLEYFFWAVLKYQIPTAMLKLGKCIVAIWEILGI